MKAIRIHKDTLEVINVNNGISRTGFSLLTGFPELGVGYEIIRNDDTGECYNYIVYYDASLDLYEASLSAVCDTADPWEGNIFCGYAGDLYIFKGSGSFTEKAIESLDNEHIKLIMDRFLMVYYQDDDKNFHVNNFVNFTNKPNKKIKNIFIENNLDKSKVNLCRDNRFKTRGFMP